MDIQPILDKVYDVYLDLLTRQHAIVGSAPIPMPRSNAKTLEDLHRYLVMMTETMEVIVKTIDVDRETTDERRHRAIDALISQIDLMLER